MKAAVVTDLTAPLEIQERDIPQPVRGVRGDAAGGTMEIPIFDTVIKGLKIIGSIGTRQDLREVFALHAGGRTRVIAKGRKLDEVNQAMAEVLSGSALARLVFEF